MCPERVAVALSGGVDSAMAAALLVEQGHEIFGITMNTWQETPPNDDQPARPAPAQGARQVAESLDIPLHVIDAVAPFKRHVVDRFIAEYSAGRTPNPCLYCNRRLKFGALLKRALDLGADRFATGHYARVRRTPEAGWQLLRGIDPRKDQSYALYMLGQTELARLLFPLGALTKDRVREMAAARGLPAAHSQESQDLCFVYDNDYRRFLNRYAPQSLIPGPIFDRSGREVGRHRGLAAYTIGQRGGLGIAAPEALYVLDIDTAQNALIVGPQRELGRDRLIAGQVRWVSGVAPRAPVAVSAKIRYRARPAQAVVTPLDHNQVDVRFSRPLRDITPGQGVVFYDGQVVLGGGLIARSFSR